MNSNEMFISSVVRDLEQMWGGELPSWDDYRQAHREDRVRPNKTVAAQLANTGAMPRPYFIMYTVLTPGLGCLVVPAALVAWLALGASPWWIFGALIVGWFLLNLTRAGWCQGMLDAAAEDEQLYEALVIRGAFLFGPP